MATEKQRVMLCLAQYDVPTKLSQVWEKLHFTSLNYTTYYTLYSKLFDCIFCTLNYDICYTLHPYIKFGVKLDGNSKFRMQSVINKEYSLE